MRWIVELCVTVSCGELKACTFSIDICRRNASVNKLSEWFALDTCISTWVRCKLFLCCLSLIFQHFFLFYHLLPILPFWFMCERWLLANFNKSSTNLFFQPLLFHWKFEIISFNGLAWIIVLPSNLFTAPGSI